MPNPSIVAPVPFVAAPAPAAPAPPIVAPPAVLAPSFPEPEIIHASTPVSLFSQLLPSFLLLIIIFSLPYLITLLTFLNCHSPLFHYLFQHLFQHLSAFFSFSFFLFC